MASLIDPRLRQALRNGAQPALIAYLDHPDGPTRVWSRSGTLRWDGYDWQGVGTLGRISGVSQSNDLALKQVALSLSGVPPFATKTLSGRVRGRVARVWFTAVMGKRVIGAPELIVDAICDYQTLKIEDSGAATITITANVGFWSIERAVNIAWTHEQQQSVYPGDTGLSLLPSLTNKESNWRKT
jgi:hypothetical protein